MGARSCSLHLLRIAIAVVFLLILDGVGVPMAMGSSPSVAPIVSDYIVPVLVLSAILAVGNLSACSENIKAIKAYQTIKPVKADSMTQLL